MTRHDMESQTESAGYERWSPLSASPPPVRIWGKAALMLVCGGFHIGLLIHVDETFPNLPIGDTIAPAIMGNAVGFALIAIARLRSRRDWLALSGLSLLFGLGGLAATILAALGLTWGELAAPEFLTGFILAVLFAIPVYHFAFPWCERRGLISREDWRGPAREEKQSGEEGEQ